MRASWLMVLVLGCGARASAPTVAAPEPAEVSAPDDAPPIAWSEGSDLLEVPAVAVAFRVHAPLARFAPDEVGTGACGDRLVHALVVDRRTFEPSDAALWRTFLRAGCAMPDEVSIEELIVEGDEIRGEARFASGDVEGAWRLRAVTLRRAHRVIVIVSAIREGLEGELFERTSDAPGLEAVGAPPSPDRHEDTTARDTMELVFGVLDVVGEVARAFRR